MVQLGPVNIVINLFIWRIYAGQLSGRLAVHVHLLHVPHPTDRLLHRRSSL